MEESRVHGGPGRKFHGGCMHSFRLFGRMKPVTPIAQTGLEVSAWDEKCPCDSSSSLPTFLKGTKKYEI